MEEPKQSKVDECVFYEGRVSYVLYTDNSILTGPDKADIDQVIQGIKDAKLDVTKEEDIQVFGVYINRPKDGMIFMQLHLID